MKKCRQFIQSFFTRHIIGPAPLPNNTVVRENTPDLEMVRFSVWQHLRVAKKDEKFLLSYVADYATIMDELRMEGWKVQLQAAADGTLAYVISAGKSGTLA